MDMFAQQEDYAASDERCRMARISCGSNNSFDGDDMPHEDDLLCEIVPEKQRLQRLNEVQTPFKEEGTEPFKSACLLLAKLFDVPISLVSLLYDEFQWFKAGVGVDISYTPRCFSFCTHTLKPRKPEVLFVSDALEDERFRDSPLVKGPPHIRFYCGVPLLTEDGVRLGALCVKDRKPRAMEKSTVQFLINMAEIVVRELLLQGGTEQNKTATNSNDPVPARTPTEEGKLRRLPSMNMLRKRREKWFEQGEGVLLVDATKPKWEVLWTNPQWKVWSEHIGCSSHELWSVIKPDNGENGSEMQQTILKHLASSDSGSFSFRAQAAATKIELSPSKVMLCTVLSSTEPITHLKHTISNIDETKNASGAVPATFEGSKMIFVFVKATCKKDLPSECMDSIAEKGPVPIEVQSGEKAETTVGTKLPRLLASERRNTNDSVGGQLSKTKEKNEVSSVSQQDKPSRAENDESVAAKHTKSSKVAKLCDMFQFLDEEQTGKISREVLVNIISRISKDDNEDIYVANIKKLMDAHGSPSDDLIAYKDFLQFIFA